MAKGGVHPKLGRAIFDDDGNFLRVDVHPATEEEIAAAKRHTAEQLAKSALDTPRGSVGRGQMRALYAAQMMALVDDELAQIDPIAQAGKVADLRKQRSKLLRDQGRIREAWEADPSEENAQALEALDLADDFFCDCPRPSKFVKKLGIEQLGEKWRVKEVYYPERGGDCKLWICVVCGFKNISKRRPPTG
jgi:hypothetical protein